jgi:protein-disulfide isomerase
MLRRPLKFALLLGLGLAPLLLPAARPRAETAFTPEQRAEIVTILRDALKRDPQILRDAIAAMQADDEAQQKARSLAAIAARKNDLVQPSDPFTGDPRASVTIVEFFDVRCPYCRKLEPEMAALMAHDPSVKLVYKDLPILGPASVLGAKALLAAQKQDKYVPMRDALMRMSVPPTQEIIDAEAGTLGIDTDRLRQDMNDPAIQARIDTNLKLASALGIEGTPALVIGTQLIPGAVDTSELQKAVDAAR